MSIENEIHSGEQPVSTSDSITAEPAHAEIECNKSDLKQPDDRLLAAANDLRETAARLETTADTRHLQLAETFAKLRDSVAGIRDRADQSAAAAESALEKFGTEVSRMQRLATTAEMIHDQRRLTEVDRLVSTVIAPLHDKLFEAVVAIDAGGRLDHAGVLVGCLAQLELNLEASDIEVIKPQVGQLFDAKSCEAIGAVPIRIWNRTVAEHTVARVIRCGFAVFTTNDDGSRGSMRVLRRAAIEVYRRH